MLRTKRIATMRHREAGLQVKTAKISLTLLSDKLWQADIADRTGPAGSFETWALLGRRCLRPLFASVGSTRGHI
jgi:hypothetical protein